MIIEKIELKVLIDEIRNCFEELAVVKLESDLIVFPRPVSAMIPILKCFDKAVAEAVIKWLDK